MNLNLLKYAIMHSMKPLHETCKGKNRSLNVFLRRPVLYTLKSKMSASVTISNIWNSEEDKKCLDGAMDFSCSVYRDMRDLDIYFGCLWGKKLPEFLG